MIPDIPSAPRPHYVPSRFFPAGGLNLRAENEATGLLAGHYYSAEVHLSVKDGPFHDAQATGVELHTGDVFLALEDSAPSRSRRVKVQDTKGNIGYVLYMTRGGGSLVEPYKDLTFMQKVRRSGARARDHASLNVRVAYHGGQKAVRKSMDKVRDLGVSCARGTGTCMRNLGKRIGQTGRRMRAGVSGWCRRLAGRCGSAWKGVRRRGARKPKPKRRGRQKRSMATRARDGVVTICHGLRYLCEDARDLVFLKHRGRKGSSEKRRKKRNREKERRDRKRKRVERDRSAARKEREKEREEQLRLMGVAPSSPSDGGTTNAATAGGDPSPTGAGDQEGGIPGGDAAESSSRAEAVGKKPSVVKSGSQASIQELAQKADAEQAHASKLEEDAPPYYDSEEEQLRNTDPSPADGGGRRRGVGAPPTPVPPNEWSLRTLQEEDVFLQRAAGRAYNSLKRRMMNLGDDDPNHWEERVSQCLERGVYQVAVEQLELFQVVLEVATTGGGISGGGDDSGSGPPSLGVSKDFGGEDRGGLGEGGTARAMNFQGYPIPGPQNPVGAGGAGGTMMYPAPAGATNDSLAPMSSSTKISCQQKVSYLCGEDESGVNPCWEMELVDRMHR